MPVVNVHIGKRDYQLACGEGQEERLYQLAKELSKHISTLSKQLNETNDSILLVMTALMLQDQIEELQQQQGAGQADDAKASATALENEEALAEALDAVSDYVDTIAGRMLQNTAS